MKRLHITATGDAVFAEPAGSLVLVRGGGLRQAEAVPDAHAPSDAEILARVAKRRAFKMQAQAAEREAHAKALDAHVRAKCAELGIGADVLEHEASREQLTRAFKGSFRPSLDLASAGKAAVHRMCAAQELPDCCKSERWATSDCQCVVERVYHCDCPEDSHTFHAEPCAAHAGMSNEELHDVLEEETRRRGGVHRWLDAEGIDCSALSFAWSGSGASRTLIVQGVALGERTKDFAALVDGLSGKVEVEVAGGIEIASGV